MAVRIISTTELRSKAAEVVQGLKRGDEFLIQHYTEIVGYITSEVPELDGNQARGARKNAKGSGSDGDEDY